MSCHSGGGEGGTFTVAGTVFPAVDSPTSAGVNGATVEITDANGQTLQLTTNAAGNFFTKQAVSFPISAAVIVNGQRIAMAAKQGTGACSSCHNQPPTGGAPGRVHTP